MFAERKARRMAEVRAESLIPTIADERAGTESRNTGSIRKNYSLGPAAKQRGNTLTEHDGAGGDSDYLDPMETHAAKHFHGIPVNSVPPTAAAQEEVARQLPFHGKMPPRPPAFIMKGVNPGAKR